MFRRNCTSNINGCYGELEFDGQFSCLLNMNGFCVTYEVLQSFVKLHKDAGNNMISDIFSYNHYRHSWYSFLFLLDADHEIGFMCSKCERLPQVVIMDATPLAFRRDLDFLVPKQHSLA